MFYERFVELCDENKISQSAAVQKIGLNRAAINKWKKGSIPQGATVSKLAELFGVTADYLLGNVNEPFFYLDNERILREINGDGGASKDILDELDVAFMGDYSELTEENKATLRDMARLMLKNQGGGKE